MPEAVRDFAQEVIARSRKSPQLNDVEVAAIQDEMAELVDADKATTRSGLNVSKLFPTRKDYNGKVAIGGNLPFDQTALPFTSGLNVPPIATPKPDVHYGYPVESFSTREAAMMLQPQLNPFAQPITANCWPFFAVEFKSGSRGGTRWVAENQNAGTGAHCVNSIETLLRFVADKDKGDDQNRPRKVVDSLAFSCVAESDAASLWVHCRTDDDNDGNGNGNGGRFVSSEIEFYSFKKAQDVRAFRAGVRNIIDHALAERLDMVQKALKELAPLLHCWDQESKTAKTRRPSSSSSQLVDEPLSKR